MFRILLTVIAVAGLWGCDDRLPPANRADTGPSGGADQSVEDGGTIDSSGSGDCTSNEACSDDQYCHLRECAGRGGVCEDRPMLCPENCPGVCGCDGVNYCNECEAAAAGVSVDGSSSCTGPPPMDCSTDEGICDSTQYCMVPSCGASVGTCKERPKSCPIQEAPVCGCDGISYVNDCEAGRAGVSIAHAGNCKCATDTDCIAGKQWCEGGYCVTCDNLGTACDLACPIDWDFYSRNGCTPCDCAPPSACTKDADCSNGQSCYAGDFCWDWCPPGDSRCCLGNVCSNTGCESSPPISCRVRGCPLGETCDFSAGCSPSHCSCSTSTGIEGTWACTKDCVVGSCVSY